MPREVKARSDFIDIRSHTPEGREERRDIERKKGASSLAKREGKGERPVYCFQKKSSASEEGW